MNANGQEEHQLYNGYIKSGMHQFNTAASDIQKGIKYVIVAGNKKIKTKKLVIF